MYIYIYISAGPSLEGATRLRGGSPVKSSTVTFLSLKFNSYLREPQVKQF